MEKKNINVILAIIICLAVAGTLIFISINNKVNNTNMPLNDNTNNMIPNNTVDNTPASVNPTLAGEIAKTGLPAQAGDTVSMNYTGRLENGTVFDSNVDPKFNHVEPFEFTLGAGQVIAGWDKGIVGMKIGEKKTLTIPPADGYGANGQGPIPPNSTLIFEVELLAIKK
ncbi:MAG: FKBP-type peptidyl-prolyl cis-trans isomerase [Candidatus Nomurabacteria bacterium GW2011_GWA2_41_25]|uniref:Peptidyl-prolyl cis-trans isomerase n=1 Tax=Candidatus Nomurabacteria bacterium GW2011_GWA2_41_25 TaxID=1618736 RepID=A0A0G0VVJ3_9BACT|nr:MAG: FKBP-type peptidyl-prolyl cis-trans isomerase [Candidatus Nomurabacteria bacterium GW2011_GWA2_41_25]